MQGVSSTTVMGARVQLRQQEEYSSFLLLVYGIHDCFPMLSACFLFYVKRQVPAVSSTAVKGAQVHLMQQEEYMTVSLYLFANSRLCGKTCRVHRSWVHENSFVSKRCTVMFPYVV